MLGDPERPLLVSVRSGARASMPGMMDTILNLGLNDATAKGLARRTGSTRFAFDAYRRFVQMFATVALSVKKEPFEHALEESRRRVASTRGIDVTRLNAEELRRKAPVDAAGRGQVIWRWKALVPAMRPNAAKPAATAAPSHRVPVPYSPRKASRAASTT